ncbi:hypothetical protein [Maribacter sp.]|uniref:hypothetical protein n=1 Tax=Maribacter sp. TaxID=1897614 RepID=UPI0025C6B64F|nr:hypothetical protein [Maribacter sp.]
MPMYLQFLLQTTDVVVEYVFRESLEYDLLIATITGILSGIIASGLFFLTLRVFKPKIQIASKIVKQQTTNDLGEPEIIYWFKFINMTKADIENVSIDLFLMEDFFNGSAKNYNTKRLKIAQPEFKFLTGKGKRSTETYNNCVQMKILEPLEEMWNGKKEWLHLQIDSTHSQSGRRKVHVKKYQDPSSAISNGKFDSGENFNILN